MVRRNSIEASTRSSMAESSDDDSIHGADPIIAKLKMLENQLMNFSHKQTDSLQKVDSMEARLDTKIDSLAETMNAMQRTLSQLSNQLGIRPIEAETSRQTYPVTFSDAYVRDDHNRLPLDNRKSLLRKIELPKFEGSDAYDWLSKVERIFRVGRYSDSDKLDLVALSLEGDVLKWFNWQLIRREFRSWEDFRRRLFRKFGAAPAESPGNRLFAIKQTGTVSASVTELEELSAQVIEQQTVYKEDSITQLQVPVSKLEHSLQIHIESPNVCEHVVGCAELGTDTDVSAYVTKSEELSSQVVGLDASHLEQIFDNGLPTEMKEVLKLKEPRVLENQNTDVLRMETSSFCQPFSAETLTSKPVGSVSSLSFAVGTTANWSSGLSQNRQVWEPGGVLAEHVLVDFIVAAQLAEKYAEESEESLDGTEDVVPVAARGPEVPNELLFGTMDNTLHLLEMGFSKHEISMAIDQIGTEGQISPTLSEDCTQVLLEPRMQVTEALVNARLAKKPIILTNWVKLIAEKSICSEIPGYYRPSVRVGDALLDVVTTPVIDDAIFQFVLDRTVSREWHRWKHKTAYDGVIAANVLVDGLVDFNGYDGIVDGIRRLAIDSRRASRVWERGGLDISPFVSFNLQSYSSWCGWRVFDRGKNNKWDAHVDSLISSMLPSYAQDIMTRQADKKRRNVEFSVGDWVYIKLQPYRQLSVMHRIHQELAAKFFDLFLVIKLIGMVASELEDFVSLYPISKLEDKLVFEGACIDTTQQVIIGGRRRRKPLWLMSWWNIQIQAKPPGETEGFT